MNIGVTGDNQVDVRVVQQVFGYLLYVVLLNVGNVVLVDDEGNGHVEYTVGFYLLFYAYDRFRFVGKFGTSGVDLCIEVVDLCLVGHGYILEATVAIMVFEVIGSACYNIDITVVLSIVTGSVVSVVGSVIGSFEVDIDRIAYLIAQLKTGMDGKVGSC